VAQEAHEAVRPTHFEVTPDKYQGQDQMAIDQAKLYSLIWRRTMACQMADAIYDDTKVVVTAADYDLTANGVVVKFEGWRTLFKKDKEENQVLPALVKGEKLSKKDLTSEQKFTQPPARFNDASLIKELEKRGIGRPSTYATIISTIQDRRYVDQKDKKFYPTTIGIAVVDFLKENFPKEMDYEFTARMEDELDGIASGKVKWEAMLSKFWDEFKDRIIRVDKDSARVGVPTTSTGIKCPTCGIGEVVIRDGKFGKFYSCNRYPECKYTAPFVEYVEGVVCEKCGKRVVLKKTQKGKAFYGCEDYPNCTWASWKKPLTKEEENLEAKIVEMPEVEVD
jgi:DNA topoisomerase-1